MTVARAWDVGTSTVSVGRAIWLWAAVLVWTCAVLAGVATLWRYGGTPGIAADPPVDWPAGTSLQLAADRPTLLVFAHPQCPCTRATVEELDALLRETSEGLTATLVMLDGAGLPSAEESALHERARRIPGLRLMTDRDGAEAARFGAETSGQTLLYDRRGVLLFRGGITVARGHIGESEGRREITALTLGRSSSAVPTPVYGCALQEDERR